MGENGKRRRYCGPGSADYVAAALWAENNEFVRWLRSEAPMTENSKIDWSKAVDPRDVMWLRSYCIQWDALIALPVLKASPAALKAIERGIVTEVSRDEAQALNEPFSEQEWLKEMIEARWEQIEQRVADLHKISTTLRIRLPADYVASDGPDLPSGENLLLRHISMREISVYSPGEKVIADDVVLQPFDAVVAVNVQRYPDTTYMPADYMTAMDGPRLPKEAEQDRIWNLLVQACQQ